MSDRKRSVAEGGYSRKLVRSVAYNLFGGLWGSLLTILTLPYIVHKLGNNNNGLMTLIMVITGYFTFLDFGMGNALIKYMSERGQDAPSADRDGRMIFAALVSNTVAGAIGATIIFLGAARMTSWLRLPIGDRPLAILAFQISSLVFLINMFAAVFSAIPQGRQRFDALMWVSAFMQTIRTAGMVLLLALGHSLISVMWLFVFAALLSCAVFMIVSKRLLPGVRFVPVFDAGAFRKLFSFGFYSTVARIASLLTLQLDRLLIGMMMNGLRWVSYYAVSSTASGYIYQIASKSGSVILPAASELKSSGDDDRLRNLLVHGSRYILICCLPLTALLTALPGPTLRAWMGVEGPEYARCASTALVMLTLGNCLQGVAIAPSMVLMGIGMARLTSAISLVSGFVIAGLCLLLIPRMGISGAATAYAASMVAFLIPLYAYSCVKTRCGLKELIGNGLGRPLAAGVVNFVVLLAAKQFVVGRLSLIMVALAGGFVYIGALVVFKAVNEKDAALVKSFLRSGK